MKLLSAVAIATVIGISALSAPAQAGLFGDAARKVFWTGEKILRNEPCQDRARAVRDQEVANAKGAPFGIGAVVAAQSQEKLSNAIRKCKRFQ